MQLLYTIENKVVRKVYSTVCKYFTSVMPGQKLKSIDRSLEHMAASTDELLSVTLVFAIARWDRPGPRLLASERERERERETVREAQ